MAKATPKQRAILQFIADREVKKAEIVEHFSNWHSHNGAFHIGMILSRMVKSRQLVRFKAGWYRRPDVQEFEQIGLFKK